VPLILADAWLRNSFGALNIQSTLTGWIDIDQSELETSPYRPDSIALSRVNQRGVSNAIIKALNILDTRPNLNGNPGVLLRAGHLATAYAGPNTLPRCAAGPARTWSDFDGDGDGQIDMITVIHSGYGAELGVSDADGMAEHNQQRMPRPGTVSQALWMAGLYLV
jgi:hypothetical protein